MDLIFDELNKNNVDTERNTLSYHINYLLEHHKALHDHARMCAQSEDLDIIVDHLNVQHFGHAMAYLTLVYTMKVRRCHTSSCA